MAIRHEFFLKFDEFDVSFERTTIYKRSLRSKTGQKRKTYSKDLHF